MGCPAWPGGNPSGCPSTTGRTPMGTGGPLIGIRMGPGKGGLTMGTPRCIMTEGALTVYT